MLYSKYNFLSSLGQRIRNGDVSDTRALKFSPQRANRLKELSSRVVTLGTCGKLYVVANFMTFHKNNSIEGPGMFGGIITGL